MLVKITDKEHKYFGQELEGFCFYYDYQHTGDSPDIYIIKTPEGERKILSTQIDVEHYENQRLSKEIERLGANVGDKVIIIESGSGGSKVGFDINEPHIITKISPSGAVYFDDGMADMFRPIVKVVS
jgi:hypothetical protein